MTSILASVIASLVAWGVTALLGDHVSFATETVVSFVVWAIVFVPTFVWVKRLRDGG